MRRSNSTKKAKLYVFPGTKEDNTGMPGPVWKSPRLYRCKDCGNTRLFYGHTVVPTVLTVAAVSPFHYDVMEYAIPEEEEVDHVVTTCAECGSSDVETYEVDVKTMAIHNVADKEGVWSHLMLKTDALPPHERDVVRGADGNWYVGCERTRDYLLFGRFQEQNKDRDERE